MFSIKEPWVECGSRAYLACANEEIPHNMVRRCNDYNEGCHPDAFRETHTFAVNTVQDSFYQDAAKKEPINTSTGVGKQTQNPPDNETIPETPGDPPLHHLFQKHVSSEVELKTSKEDKKFKLGRFLMIMAILFFCGLVSIVVILILRSENKILRHDLSSDTTHSQHSAV